MKRHYLHLSVYPCDKCEGPVVSGSVAVRENEISKETDIREIGAVCLSCSHRRSKATEPGVARHFPPIEWPLINAIGSSNIKMAFVEMLDRVAGLNISMF